MSSINRSPSKSSSNVDKNDKIISKLIINDLFNDLKEENTRLLNDLKICQKFMENYRKLLLNFNENCICNQNIGNKTELNKLENYYKNFAEKQTKHRLITEEIFNENNNQLLIENKTNLLNDSNDIKEESNYLTEKSDKIIESDSDFCPVSDDNKEETNDFMIDINEGINSDWDSDYCPDSEDIKDNKKNHFLRVKTNVSTNIDFEYKKIRDKKGKCFYVCQWTGCGHKTTKRVHLLSHLRNKHTNEKPFKCLICNKCFALESILRRHQKKCPIIKTTIKKPKAVKPVKPIEKFKCEYPGCLFETQFPINLRKHRKRHENRIKIYKCNEINCDKSYYTKRDLMRHKNSVHLNLRPFGCDWPGCDARFTSRPNLRDHRLFHLKERTFKCDFNECPKSFITNKLLIRHKQRHTRPFPCHWPGCTASLDTNRALDAHLNEHQDIRPFPCNFENCLQSFHGKEQLYQHLYHKHKTRSGYSNK